MSEGDEMDGDIIKSTSDFIEDLKSRLRQERSYDQELVEIVVSNILSEIPSADAVQKSFDAIKLIADQRAKESGDVSFIEN